jgi:hypothetical protein
MKLFAARLAASGLAASLSLGLALGPVGCDDSAPEEVALNDDMDLFADGGKTDTGYVSDQAAEVNAELVGKVVIDLSQRDQATRDSLLAAARAGDKTAFTSFPTDQVKFARNVLKKEKFNANIESGSPTIDSVKLVSNDTKVEVTYKLVVESLIKEKDLKAGGLSLAQIIGKKVDILVPADPKTAFTWGGVACAEDPDDPTEDVASELYEYNYFYYWKADKAGCPVTSEKVAFTVKNTSAAKSTYPEFDQLLADKKITMVVLFGQLEHGDLLSGQNDEWDWGWIGYEDLTYWLKDEGFTEKTRVPARAPVGKVQSSKWSKKYHANLTVEVDVISPMDLQDHADSAKKDEILKNAVKTHEIVYYNGHSFYGSLKVLDDKANFPEYYQIIFMDSCWSYAYYTKQVFTAKATAADPSGMLKADVLNNTEPGISGSHVTFSVFLKKLFTAATYVAKGQKSSAKNYTWKNLVTYMNTSAKKRSEDSKKEDPTGGHEPEIYGVSGVTTNVWKP